MISMEMIRNLMQDMPETRYRVLGLAFGATRAIHRTRISSTSSR